MPPKQRRFCPAYRATLLFSVPIFSVDTLREFKYTQSVSTIVLWVSDMELQREFYSALFDTTPRNSSSEFSEVSDNQNCVLLHLLAEPFRIFPDDVRVQDEVAIKPVFVVKDIDKAQSRIASFKVNFGSERMNYGDFTYLDCIDPEGNVIQLRENADNN